MKYKKKLLAYKVVQLYLETQMTSITPNSRLLMPTEYGTMGSIGFSRRAHERVTASNDGMDLESRDP